MAGFRVVRAETAFSLDKSGKHTQSFKDEKHLTFIRSLPSVVSGNWPVEACHIRSGSADHHKKVTGKGQKPSDCWTLPLTPEEHRDQHSGSEMAFWLRHGINPFEIADKLYQVSGDRETALSIILNARQRIAPIHPQERM
ncbi:DUF968 domain-containing protein [Ochrobactrum sp. SFR4]|uniref:DUF968 domain-containing protein n=1 Tax=Ochrobactrum sp. SFR4 TaxID=2717368 RepID=UPI001C8B7EC2|nr:DUF968 domain-containing protein [Ochrobactrum sp. SFR4]